MGWYSWRQARSGWPAAPSASTRCSPPSAKRPTERPLVGLEAAVAAAPSDDANLRALGQAYLDAHAPGLALALIERAPEQVRTRTKVEHLYARALLEEGHAQDALAIERQVLRTCTIADGVCDSWLIASARRRADILTELVGLGVEDARAEPEASAIAYHNATREARIALR